MKKRINMTQYHFWDMRSQMFLLKLFWQRLVFYIKYFDIVHCSANLVLEEFDSWSWSWDLRLLIIIWYLGKSEHNLRGNYEIIYSNWNRLDTCEITWVCFLWSEKQYPYLISLLMLWDLIYDFDFWHVCDYFLVGEALNTRFLYIFHHTSGQGV